MKKQAYLFIVGSLLVIMAGCSKQANHMAAVNTANTTKYVQRLGNDTLTVESISKLPGEFKGKLVQRMPKTQVASFVSKLHKNGTVSNMKIVWKTPPTNPNGLKTRKYSISIKGTVAKIHMSGVWRGKKTDTTYTMSVPEGLVPSLGKYPPAISTFQQVIHQAMENGGKLPYHTKVIFPGSHRLINVKLTHISKDTLSMTELHGYAYIAKVNNKNKIVWFSGKHSTVKTIAKPSPKANIKQIADHFAKLDTEGKGMPIASPLDSAKATIDGAHMKIVYSRPSMRGRKIWGGLVPWNKVWRTGANSSTTFTTSKNLVIGNTKVPAGSYSLYSIYTPTSAKLIINSQTGQWGTVYHKSRDFARIPMQRKNITPLKKEFLISIKKTKKDGGLLEFIWDQYRYQVPFVIK